MESVILRCDVQKPRRRPLVDRPLFACYRGRFPRMVIIIMIITLITIIMLDKISILLNIQTYFYILFRNGHASLLVPIILLLGDVHLVTPLRDHFKQTETKEYFSLTKNRSFVCADYPQKLCAKSFNE